MSQENQEVVQEQQEQQEEAAVNQLAESVWGDKPVEKVEEQKQEEKKEDVIIENNNQEEKKEEKKEEILDPNVWLKREFDIDDVSVLKKEREEFKKLKEQKPFELQFANDESKKYFEALTNGKEDEIVEFLSKKRQFAQIETMNLDNAKDAEQLLKLSYQLKYKDLTSAEVNDLVAEKYSKPEKPEQPLDMEEKEYDVLLDKWKQQCEAVDKRMVRDAKIERPDVLKFKNELVLPEIPKKEEAKIEGPTQEQLDQAKKLSDSFSSFNATVNELGGFSAQVKDKDVDYSVAYTPSNEEKAAVEAKMKLFQESGFDANSIFVNRWLNDDGTANVKQMAEDLLLLESKDAALSKMANEAANQRLEQYIKSKKNVKIDTETTKTFEPVSEKTEIENLREQVWS